MKVKLPPIRKEGMGIFSEDQQKKLVEYMNDEKINNFIKEMNSRYLSWDEFVYHKIPNDADRELIWMLMKFNRESTAKKLKINSAEELSFKFNLSDNAQQKLHECDMSSGGMMSSILPKLTEQKNRYLISSIMEESIASSQLEGAATTRKVAKEMLKSGRKPKNKSEQMILNNYLTAKMIKDSNIKKLTPEFILEVHKHIAKETLEDNTYEGKFRDSDDIKVVDKSTGEISYHPPKYELIPKLLTDVCKFINEPSPYFIHPIIKASILHFLIGYIHPFVDGNGRTARSLFYWYLSKENYWIIEFMSISRVIIKSPAQYARAYLYTETDENDLTYFINYQLKTLNNAFKELSKYLSKEEKEKKELFDIIKNIEGINTRQAYILKKFYEDARKTMTIKEIQEVFNTVYQTARQDLLELEKKGFLERKIMGKKQIVFFSSNKFEELMKNKINKK